MLFRRLGRSQKVSVNEIVHFCFAAQSVVPFCRAYLIGNMDELLKIEDADLARYSPAERAALLGRFAIMPVPARGDFESVIGPLLGKNSPYGRAAQPRILTNLAPASR